MSTPAPPLDATSYRDAVHARQARFRPAAPALAYSSSYELEPVFTVPHAGTHIHAFAAPPCASHLYTGGSDGFVRRYALHATLNGTGIDNPLVPNLTSKPGGHERPPGTDLRQPVLSGYWENEDPGDWADDLLPPSAGDDEVQQRAGKVRWGQKTGAVAPQSAVYSLAVQKEELWGLSGTARGSINLWTIRHDEGQTRHVFRPDATSPLNAPSSTGHSPKAGVSVLALDQDETSFLSGGWDGRILQWDLHTGSSTRSFHAHAAQVSSIAYRPLRPPTALAHAGADGDTEMGDAAGDERGPDAPGRVRSDEAAQGAGATGRERRSTRKDSGATGAADEAKKGDDSAAADADADADADGEADADADGEIDDSVLTNTSPHSTLPTRTPDFAKPDKIPLIGDAGELNDNVFLSTGLDGTVLLWDRRAAEGQGVVRRWDKYEPPAGERGKKEGASGAWCTSACWSPSGTHVYVGRRSPSLQVYDLRSSAPLSTLSLPLSTGPVSSVAALPNGRHVLTASWDCVRMWDVEEAMRASEAGAGVGAGDAERKGKGWFPAGATVVPGHHGGTVSAMQLDGTCRWMFTTSGNRGWDGTTTENLSIHEVKVRPGSGAE